MTAQYILYFVTGGREVYYAAVDTGTGRAWTAPTKDGAIRQAREAGLESFIEKSISRNELLRSLGIGGDLKIHEANIPTRAAPLPDHESQTPHPAPGAWFVAGGDHPTGSGLDENFSMPRLMRNTKRASRGNNAKSPFAGSQPISEELLNASKIDDDVLILPAAAAEKQRQAEVFRDGDAANL